MPVFTCFRIEVKYVDLNQKLMFLKQDVDIKWVEYQNMVKYLSQWIKHNVTVMSDRNFPSNPVDLKVRTLTFVVLLRMQAHITRLVDLFHAIL